MGIFELKCSFPPSFIYFMFYHVDLILCTSTSVILLCRLLVIHNSSSHERTSYLLPAITQTDDSPPAAPSPLPGTTVTATALHGPEFLVFALGQTNDNVSLDSAERKDAEAGARSKRADGFGEGSGRVPESLCLR